MTLRKADSVLEEALNIINADRRVEYGDPIDSFTALAEVWTWYLRTRHKVEITLSGTDVAMIMSLLKVSRHTTGQPKRDNLVDICGYAALAGQFITDIGDAVGQDACGVWGAEPSSDEVEEIVDNSVDEFPNLTGNLIAKIDAQGREIKELLAELAEAKRNNPLTDLIDKGISITRIWNGADYNPVDENLTKIAKDIRNKFKQAKKNYKQAMKTMYGKKSS